jgi:hypothetical protein
MRNNIIEALEIATKEFKAEERRKPGPVRLEDSSAGIAARYGWSVGQRDMAVKMHLEHRSLAEIKAEIKKPAEEIARVLRLNNKIRKPSRFLSPEALELMVRLRGEGFKVGVIADILNADGVKTAAGKTWTKGLVSGQLTRHKHSKKNMEVPR